MKIYKNIKNLIFNRSQLLIEATTYKNSSHDPWKSE